MSDNDFENLDDSGSQSLENGDLDTNYGGGESQLSDTSVRYSYTQYSISTLIEWIEDGIITIPPYQRRFIWKKSQSALLIDSILRGLPIPPVVLFENSKTNTLELIDGLQRILSMYYYYKNKFPKNSELYNVHDVEANPEDFEDFSLTPTLLSIKKSDKITETLSTAWLNKFYKDLGLIKADNVRNYQHKFKSYIVGVLQINSLTPSYETTLELFSRLNKGGTQLEINEIRMRTASEGTLSKMREVLHNTHWDELISKMVPPRKDTSRELLLRILVMLDKYETRTQIIPMHRMLDELMKNDFSGDEKAKQSFPSDLLDKYRTHILAVLEKISNVQLDKKPFVFGASTRLNSSLAETIITPLTFASIQEREISNDDVIALINLLSSPTIKYQEYEENFDSIMGRDSSKIKSILTRHAIASEFILKVNFFSEQLKNYDDTE